MKVMSLILAISLVFVVSGCTAQNAQQMQKNSEMTPGKTQQTEGENQAKDCRSYEPAVVELKGNLSIKTFFGPPNFGENPSTDSKENSWILSLTSPMNVCAKIDGDPTSGPSVENVRELQLVLPKSRKELIGKDVIVVGTLFHAHTGHHHTDVLMTVQSISPIETK